jgi:hypothetical protein
MLAAAAAFFGDHKIIGHRDGHECLMARRRKVFVFDPTKPRKSRPTPGTKAFLGLKRVSTGTGDEQMGKNLSRNFREIYCYYAYY